MNQSWCRACGADVPPRYGEGTCKICDPVGVKKNKEKNDRTALVPYEPRSDDLPKEQ